MMLDSYIDVAGSYDVDLAGSAFNAAYKKTMGIEGLYSDDPVDPGGETFLGISRYWHPSWPGWGIIDKWPDPGHLPKCVMTTLYELAEQFYRVQFWDRLQGERLTGISIAIAEKVFDTAVNLSVTDAVRFLQDSLNLLNLNGVLYPDLVVDGRIGPVTMERLHKYIITRPGTSEQNERRLLNVFRFLQGGHYINEMRQHPEKERFRGWFDRAAA